MVHNRQREKQEAGYEAARRARMAIENACEEKGLTPDIVIQRVREALDADVIKVALTTMGWSTIQVGPDHRTRLQAADMALDLLGGRAPHTVLIGPAVLHEDTSSAVEALLLEAGIPLLTKTEVPTACLRPSTYSTIGAYESP